MNKHVASEHEGEEPFKCDICGHLFSLKSVINKHVASEPKLLLSVRVIFYGLLMWVLLEGQ
jgi:uncharacterized C2H2 Zn-finger protein